MTRKNFWTRWWFELALRCERAMASSMRASAAFARPAVLVTVLIVVVPLCIILVRSALHATVNVITVNTLADETTPGDKLCSLREAINNANSASDTTSGDCAAGKGNDLINFSVSGTIT